MKSLLKPRSRAAREFQRRIVRSRFFAVSAVLHVLLIATFGTRKFFKKSAEPADFAASDVRIFLSATQPVAATSLPIEARTAKSAFKEPAAASPEISGANAPGRFRNRRFDFAAFVARYSGDWDSTVWFAEKNEMRGSLPNLIRVVARLSKNKIAVRVSPTAIDLSNWDE